MADDNCSTSPSSASPPPRFLSLKNWRELSDSDFQLLVSSLQHSLSPSPLSPPHLLSTSCRLVLAPPPPPPILHNLSLLPITIPPFPLPPPPHLPHPSPLHLQSSPTQLQSAQVFPPPPANPLLLHAPPQNAAQHLSCQCHRRFILRSSRCKSESNADFEGERK